jgi:hypothetical protein
MKIFEHFNQSSICPICGTNEDKPATLIGIDGTEDGGNMEALQVHVDCLNIRLKRYPECSVVYFSFKEI